MSNISVLEKNKEYVVLRIPRKLLERADISYKNALTETAALKVLRAGLLEYKQGKTRTLTSLRALRHGN